MTGSTLHSRNADEVYSEHAAEMVRQLLDTLIRRSSIGYAEVSRLIGRNPAYIQQFIKRGIPRRLTEADRRILSAHFGVSEARLGGPETPFARLSPDSAPPPQLEFPFTGAGDPDRLPLRIDSRLLQRLPQATLPGLTALSVEGDSMSPTLLAGDLLLIDSHDCVAARDGIYVIGSGAGQTIRRLSVHPVTRRVAILADNAIWPSFPDCDPAEIPLQGRVVWVSRALV